MDTTAFDELTGTDLDEIEARLRAATPGPWKSYVEGRDHTSGSSFVATPSSDIELAGATVADQDFIAHAREDLPRLLNEVRRLRARGQQDR
ncbi:MAG TPA: hypothetical protein VME47_04245 [Acetobacteraceae bacterium]|nr:hypothetical protein [Acetobacteraceae bacterium]